MTMIDPEQEKKRLAEFYSHMSDGELVKVFDDANSLTDIARDALLLEIENRKLEMPGEENSPRVFELGDFVMLRRYRDLSEAMMAKGALESAGIECYFVDENIVRMDWMWSNLLGGVKIYVHAEDVSAGEEILSEPPPESYEVEGLGTFERPKCPKCGSLEIAFEELSPLAYASAYLFVPIPLHLKGWLCHSCGHHWMDKEEEAERKG
jgi:hypothetical protein